MPKEVVLPSLFSRNISTVPSTRRYIRRPSMSKQRQRAFLNKLKLRALIAKDLAYHKALDFPALVDEVPVVVVERPRHCVVLGDGPRRRRLDRAAKLHALPERLDELEGGADVVKPEERA